MDKIPLKKRYLQQYISPSKDSGAGGSQSVGSPSLDLSRCPLDSMSISLENINTSLDTTGLSIGTLNTSIDLNLSIDKQLSLNGYKPIHKNTAQVETTSIGNISDVQCDITGLLNSSVLSMDSKKSRKSRNDKKKYEEDELFEPPKDEEAMEESIEIEDEVEMIEKDDISEIRPKIAGQVPIKEESHVDQFSNVITENGTKIAPEQSLIKTDKLGSVKNTLISKDSDSMKISEGIKNEEPTSIIEDIHSVKESEKSSKSKHRSEKMQTTEKKKHDIIQKPRKSFDSLKVSESRKRKKINYSDTKKMKVEESPPKKSRRMPKEYNENSDLELDTDSDDSSKKASLSTTFKNIVESREIYFAPRQTRNQKRHEKILLGEIEDEEEKEAQVVEEIKPVKEEITDLKKEVNKAQKQNIDKKSKHSAVVDNISPTPSESKRQSMNSSEKKRRKSKKKTNTTSSLEAISDTKPITSSNSKIKRKRKSEENGNLPTNVKDSLEPDNDFEQKITPRKRRRISIAEEKSVSKELVAITRKIKRKTSIQQTMEDGAKTKKDIQVKSKESFEKSEESDSSDVPISQSRLFRQIQENPWTIESLPRRRTRKK